ncbi:unnamed protein product [Calicophoron daubneyi]|uniref:Phosphate transporter n=1 Tax=Calicophoron daubneyi TaxID=300641 RepID=A0AAV2TSY3_CALDB
MSPSTRLAGREELLFKDCSQIMGTLYIPEDQIWMIIVGFVVAFILAFGIGANDVANSFGTSVGAKVLSLRQACACATICELAGSILLGAKVSTTIRRGIIDVDRYALLHNGPAVLMAGHVAALVGSCIWLLVATFFRLPVSGSHSIVGATVGHSLIVFGFQAVHWRGILQIIASWFLSPVLSGLTSVGVYHLLRKLVLCKEKPLEPALRVLPAFYGTVILVNSFSIFYDGPPMLHFDKIPLYGIFILSCGLGTITALLVKFVFVPRLRTRIIRGDNKASWYKKTYLRIFSPKTTGRGLPEPPSIASEVSISTEEEETEAIKTVPKALHTIVDDQGFTESYTTSSVEPQSLEMNTLTSKPEAVETSAANTVRVGVVTTTHPLSSDANVEGFEQTHPFEVCQSIHDSDSEVELQRNSNALTNDTQSSETDGPRPEPRPTLVIRSSLPPIDEEFDGPRFTRDRVEEVKVFSSLQILTALFGSFAHGGNDVSNAIGPLIGLWIVGTTQIVNSSMTTPIWILFYGGLGISVGLWVWGRRVIQTIGEDLTTITPSSGVCIEIGSALTVLVASKIGLPISTTHCKVGSVVAVGRARSRDNVNWGIFRNILIAWLVTLPVSGGISGLLMYGFYRLI